MTVVSSLAPAGKPLLRVGESVQGRHGFDAGSARQCPPVKKGSEIPPEADLRTTDKPRVITGLKCKIVGCFRPAKKRGLCNPCYCRAYRAGDQTIMGPYYTRPRVQPMKNVHPLVRRLFELAEKETMPLVVLAARVGISIGALSEWKRAYVRRGREGEHGARTPNVATLEACYNVLGYRLCIREAKE